MLKHVLLFPIVQALFSLLLHLVELRPSVQLQWTWRFTQVLPQFLSVSWVQSLSRVQLFVTPWTATHQASLSFTISQSLIKLMFIELLMPSNHLILYSPLLLLPSIFPSTRVFSNELVLCIRWPKYWSFSFNFQWISRVSLYFLQFPILLFLWFWLSL